MCDDWGDAFSEEVAEKRLHDGVDHPPERRREIICGKFGLEGIRPERFKDMADRLGVSSQRVREIRREALRMSRSMAEGMGLDVEAVFH